MKNENIDLISQFNCLIKKNGSHIVFDIINNFCEHNDLEGPEGLRGLLNYVLTIIKRAADTDITSEFRSLSETAYAIWAFEQLGRTDISNGIASQLRTGWDFGETRGYRNAEANYFRNFELELHIGLRLLEAGHELYVGQTNEPDYEIVSSPSQLTVEVKAPASKIGLFKGILKATKQIEVKGGNGVIILSLDHMVQRGLVDSSKYELSNEIKNLILSALPQRNTSVLGVITEWVDWKAASPFNSIQTFISSENYSLEKERLIRVVWQALSQEDVKEIVCCVSEGTNPFPYDEFEIYNFDPSAEGEKFYINVWGDN